jgi:hypothetical protein
MKKMFLLAALAIFAVACSDEGKSNDEENTVVVEEYTINLEPNTVDPWEWRYITLDDGAVVEENDGWDIAISRYSRADMAIRTPLDEDRGDENPPLQYMDTSSGRPSLGTRRDIVWSGIKAFELVLETMPPVYTLLPAHDFRSFDGEHTYQVEFTGYDPRTGILIMKVEEI